MYPLQRLHVYTQARAFALACYHAARSIDDPDVRSQLLRAARSIAANLAEGAGSDSQSVFARYIAIALSSAREVESHLHVAHDAGLLSATQQAELMNQLLNLMPRLVKLLRVVRQNAERRTKPRA